MPSNAKPKSSNGYAGRTTQGAIQVFSLTDLPTQLLGGFLGYFRNTDPTMLPPNSLTFPSINCFIPNKDKIVPREGTDLLGQPFTPDENWPIIGHMKRFATKGGEEVEIRVTQSDDTDLRDIVEILYPNPTTGILQWYQISENVNPLPSGAHRYYFDDWFDSSVETTPTIKNLRIPRAIFVNGYEDPSTKGGQVYNWTGGIGLIDNVTATNIELPVGISWRSLGFTEDTSTAGGGDAFVIINGDSYQLADPTELDTNSIELVVGTTGIVAGDIAFSRIEFDVVDQPFDVCAQNKNFMFYGNWDLRSLWMSNKFERPSEVFLISSTAVQNDLIIPQGVEYTGTGSHVYHVAIDSVSPEIDTLIETFESPQGGTNDSTWDTFGYSAGTGLHTYRIDFVSDMILTRQIGTQVGTFIPGEAIVGQTSGALARLLPGVDGANMVNADVALFDNSAPLISGEFIIGQDSGATMQLNNASYQNTAKFFKDGIEYQPTSAPFPLYSYTWFSFPAGTPYVLIDGLKILMGVDPVNGVAVTDSHHVGDVWTLTIQQDLGGPDTFKWWVDSGAQTTGVVITGGVQTLSDGIQIQFASDVGHTLGDLWDISVNQSILRAWVNFYYTLPIRRPGEGYIYQLSSNFWAMAPQESEMYVNTKYGKWSYVETVLSADLQSESVNITPLKQVSSSKVLFPYMMGYLEDTLIYVTENKTLDMIGRKEFLQLPQTTNLSQDVALDFQELSFEDGSMEYLNKRLYITSPKQATMMVYDNNPSNQYWQPPQVIPENGILSIVGNTLISHSNLRNQSFTLFTGTDGDIGSNYTVRARSPYLDFGNRWQIKNSNMSFVEGYLTGMPPMDMSLYLGINGCGGIKTHRIKPTICLQPDRAPFGQGNFGSHQNGSDIFISQSHFNEIYEQYKPILEYRLLAIEMQVVATNHPYSWLSFGVNAVVSNKNNINLKNREIISRQ